jgi:transglutaminase-like putative cysteine protease
LRRTLLVSVLPAAVIAAMWTRLESPRSGAVVIVVAVALLPALARNPWARLGLVVGGALVAARIGFHVPIGTGFFDALGSRFTNGLLDFYDYVLPVSPHEHPAMHGVILAAIFAFTVVLGFAVAARRTLVASVVLVVGAGWPATLLSGGHELRRGGWMALALLVLLIGLGSSSASLRRAALPAGAVFVAALAASASGAMSKPELLDWKNWDFYTRPQPLVGVQYVWNADYGGLHFPKRVTTVLTIKAPPTSLYWRATTLDTFLGDRWIEGPRIPVGEAAVDPLEPPAARRRSSLIRQDVRVQALRDTHLVGASVPIAYEANRILFVPLAENVAIAPDLLSRGDTYSVWSYAPHPTPRQLAASRPDYPRELLDNRFLDLGGLRPAPPFGAPRRDARIASLLRSSGSGSALEPYVPLYRLARQVVGHPSSPYAAVAALETWFRSRGGFRYDETPPQVSGMPPLAAFALRTKAGYCQHFAGAMTLMLRSLGIPSRVAVGFTSGTYDADTQEWTVTDHDAHAWVEVWFRGYGWLPFDPTPGRGHLSAPYTASSTKFDVSSLVRLFQGAGAAAALFGSAPGPKGARGGGFRADVPSSSPGTTGGGQPVLALVQALAALVLLCAAMVAAAKLAIRRARYVTRDPRRVATACRHELADSLADQRVSAPTGATLGELASLAWVRFTVDASRVASAASEARFGPPGSTRAAGRRARREVRTFRRDLRRSLSALDRVRGLLSLRSLGFTPQR